MLCFYSYGYNPGGVQSIQINIISYFSKNGIKVKLFDSEDGWVRQNLIKSNIIFEDYIIYPKEKGNLSHLIDNQDTLVLFNGHFFECILLFKQSNCNIIFWEVFYPWIDKFIPKKIIPFRYVANKIERKILNILFKNKSVAFIDVLGVNAAIKRLKKTIIPYYLPIPVKVCENKYIVSNLYDPGKLNVTYIGRAVTWKVYPIQHFVRDVNKHQLDSKIQICIITDDTKKFKELLFNNFNSNCEIVFKENLNEKEISNILNNSHLHIGMGTSALDGAKLGLPTILIDACYIPFPETYLYRWIFESKDLNLGQLIPKNDYFSDNTHSFLALINEIRSNNQFISKQCYDYVKENYSVQTVSEELLKLEKITTLKMSELANLFFFKYLKLLKYLYILR
jgi:hypothetical protein